MAVLWCNRCGRRISVSIIADGNPVALADAEQWSRSYRTCAVCGEAYCDRCMDLEPLCPKCTGSRKRPSKDHWIIRIPWMCRHSDRYLDSEFVDLLWGFTREEDSIENRMRAIRRAFPPETLSAIAEIAARYLKSFSKEEPGVIWSEANWEDGSPEMIPVEFISCLTKWPATDADEPTA